MRGGRPNAARRPPVAARREPRLALRFAVVTALGLALAGAVILGVIREIDQRQAVQAATERAEFVAGTFLAGVFRPSDARAPVKGARRNALDAAMRRYVLVDGALRVSLVGVGNRVTYSTDHRVIGTRAKDTSSLRAARAGAIVSRIADVPRPGGQGATEALVASIPVSLGKAVGVVSFEQDYGPIAASARESLLPVAGVLEGALVLLFVLLIPSLLGASRRLRAYVAEIRYRATHDALTGLSNREALSDQLAEAVADLRGGYAAVLLVDLDRFKEVNDTLGHDAGDELLQLIADRLQGVAGGAGVSRLGGDEFALVASGTTPLQAMELAQAVRDAIARPYVVRRIPVSVDASVGVALAPSDGVDPGQLIRRADVAMYAAKQGRAGVLRYDARIDLNDAANLVLMTELREAVDRSELEVHYQPIVETGTGMLRSVEALVRWNHPTRGLLQPGAFMPLAEHTRLVVELNRMVLREATRRCAEWRRHGAGLGVSVNLSVLELLDASCVHDVVGALENAGLPPSALTIEITEGAFVREPGRVTRTLDALRELGVRVAIDDFGTGYSSLGYLRTLPVDVLKIDRSFIADIATSEASRAIVAASVDLAHRLGLEVVAEGVEDDAQHDVVEALDCDLVQGYVVSRAVPAAELERLMRDASCDDGLSRAA
ncbi:MAG: bifunctional diguanylate cyclase/phosphodiesterase [Thermoleophilia bacterium]|nr:bifunctional diguanylate cyclase/phosphodiesterase [Thermoleophilia bacterium]